jgi:hypothetical protein
MIVTPELAREWLDLNTRNRNIRSRHVERLAGAILRDEWIENGDSIKRAVDGTLLDGQHRLYAVLKADLPILTLVVEGLDARSQTTVDTGIPRLMGDVLRIDGEPNGRALAGALRMLWLWRTFGCLPMGGFNTAATPQQLLALLEENPNLRDSVSYATSEKGFRPLRIPPSIIATANYELTCINVTDAYTFFDRLANPVQMREGHPVYTLRRWCENRSMKRTGAVDKELQLAVLIKAWNAYRDARDAFKLGWNPTGPHRDSFPKPI